jgi:hypothetical protein
MILLTIALLLYRQTRTFNKTIAMPRKQIVGLISPQCMQNTIENNNPGDATEAAR